MRLSAPQISCPDASRPDGHVADSTDCDDNDGTSYPGGDEVCDGEYGFLGGAVWGPVADSAGDNDCDGTVDENVRTTWYFDADSDGFGGTATQRSCEPPNRYVAQGGDCSVNDDTVYPGASELCNGVDDDCDGEVDDGVLNTYYADIDQDGAGDPLNESYACNLPASGYVFNSADCDDERDDVYGAFSATAAAAEICDAYDNDCNGLVNDGIATGGSCIVPDQVGACAAGEIAMCSGGGDVCSQTVFAEAFDDPRTAEDEDCDGIESVIYVDAPGGATSGSDASNGTPNSPVATFSKALELAVSQGATQIYVNGETYSINEEIVLVAGVDIIGGFNRGNGWSNDGITTSVVHDGTPSSGNAIALRCSSIVTANSTTISGLSILVTGKGDMGITHYGIHASNCHGLRLHDITIDVAAGSPGAAGNTGSIGTQGSIASVGVGGQLNCLTPDNLSQSSSGGNGGTGVQFEASAFAANRGGASIFDWNVNGHRGNGYSNEPAYSGHGGVVCTGNSAPPTCFPLLSDADLANSNISRHGSAGLAVTALDRESSGAGLGARQDTQPYLQSGFWSSSVSNPATRGLYGHGGGGGAGQLGNGSIPLSAGGGGGTGGCGGEPGEQGQDGGSSFGIMALNSVNMSFTGMVSITAHHGGVGGAGGTGGVGGTGQAGATSPNYAATSAARNGGAGSAGTGGGGGMGGYGGIGVPVFSSSLVDMCSAIQDAGGEIGTTISLNPDTSNGSATPAGGIAGDGGDDGSSQAGFAGVAGASGWSAECFWAHPCAQGCDGGETCLGNRCIKVQQ